MPKDLEKFYIVGTIWNQEEARMVEGIARSFFLSKRIRKILEEQGNNSNES